MLPYDVSLNSSVNILQTTLIKNVQFKDIHKIRQVHMIDTRDCCDVLHRYLEGGATSTCQS